MSDGALPGCCCCCCCRFFATALTDDTRLAVFREDQLRRLEADKPRLLLVLQRILLRQFAVERAYYPLCLPACLPRVRG